MTRPFRFAAVSAPSSTHPSRRMHRSPAHRIVHVVKVRPRLFIVALLGVVTGLLLPDGIASQPITRWLIAWNAAAITAGA